MPSSSLRRTDEREGAHGGPDLPRASDTEELDMRRIPTRTKAEQETLFRFDCEERVLWATTTTPWVARRWTRARVPLVVLSRYPDGTSASWEAKLGWTGRKADWLRLIRLSLPTVRSEAGSRAESTPERVLSPANRSRRSGRAGVPRIAGENYTGPAAEGGR